MRLFVALAPPSAALAELAQVVAPLRPAWPGLRWVARERWHVTLAFLGEVDPDRLDDLCTRLERAAGRHEAHLVRIGRGGAFPSARKARVLCAHIEGEQQALADLRSLAASLAAGARRAGAPPPDEGRRFRPHLTLARSRQPADLGALVGALSGFSGSVWTAGHVELILSQPGPSPSYETMARWPLREPRGR